MLITVLPALILAVCLFILTESHHVFASGPLADRAIASTVVVTPHLELSVTPPTVTVGAMITLHISYFNLGQPYTTITLDPENHAAFDPALTMPCKYYEHGGCTEITLRALAPGVVSITAGATGEIWDDSCPCWRWSGGTSIAPAVISIAGSSLYAPVVWR